MDPDICRAAVVMIQRFGLDAAERAAFRAQLMLEVGDIEGYAIWRAVMAGILEIQRPRRRRERLN